MTNIEQVMRLIWDGMETMTVDYKRDFYKNLHGTDFAKDIAAFANCPKEGDKWIIFGIDDKSRNIVGIDPYSYIPLDSMDNFISAASSLLFISRVRCSSMKTERWPTSRFARTTATVLM